MSCTSSFIAPVRAMQQELSTFEFGLDVSAHPLHARCPVVSQHNLLKISAVQHHSHPPRKAACSCSLSTKHLTEIKTLVKKKTVRFGPAHSTP